MHNEIAEILDEYLVLLKEKEITPAEAYLMYAKWNAARRKERQNEQGNR